VNGTMPEKTWRLVGSAGEFCEGIHSVRVEGRNFLIAYLESRFFAFSKYCPHGGGDMERCEIDGLVISCPYHAWQFDLTKSGEEIHGYTALRTFPMKVENDSVYVEF
jgi:nitrite reductase (NADH) small subunit